MDYAEKCMNLVENHRIDDDKRETIRRLILKTTEDIVNIMK